MGKKQGLIQKIASDELMNECLKKRTLIEVCNGNRVYLEHHIGIYEYSDRQIEVGVSFGRIRIDGEKLQLACMTRDSLVVTGTVCSIALVRGCQ